MVSVSAIERKASPRSLSVAEIRTVTISSDPRMIPSCPRSVSSLPARRRRATPAASVSATPVPRRRRSAHVPRLPRSIPSTSALLSRSCRLDRGDTGRYLFRQRLQGSGSRGGAEPADHRRRHPPDLADLHVHATHLEIGRVAELGAQEEMRLELREGSLRQIEAPEELLSGSPRLAARDIRRDRERGDPHLRVQADPQPLRDLVGDLEDRDRELERLLPDAEVAVTGGILRRIGFAVLLRAHVVPPEWPLSIHVV